MNDGRIVDAMSFKRIVAFFLSYLVVRFKKTFDFTAMSSGAIIPWRNACNCDTPSIGIVILVSHLHSCPCKGKPP